MAQLLDQFYLGTVLLPNGSRQVATVAGALSEIPDHAAAFGCAGFVVSADRYWLVGQGLREFRRFIDANPPVGSRRFVSDPPASPTVPGFPTVFLRRFFLYPQIGDNEGIDLCYLVLDADHVAVRARVTSAGIHMGCREFR